MKTQRHRIIEIYDELLLDLYEADQAGDAVEKKKLEKRLTAIEVLIETYEKGSK